MRSKKPFQDQPRHPCPAVALLVVVVVARRGMDCELEMDGRKCIVVEDTDIRVVLTEAWPLYNADPTGLTEAEKMTMWEELDKMHTEEPIGKVS